MMGRIRIRFVTSNDSSHKHGAQIPAAGLGNHARRAEHLFSFRLELRERKILAGNPFLSPWVSRIDGEEYYVGGKKYRFNDTLGNLYRDSNNRILHGLLIWSP